MNPVQNLGYGEPALITPKTLTLETAKKLGTPNYSGSPLISRSPEVPQDGSMPDLTLNTVALTSSMALTGLNNLRNREVTQESTTRSSSGTSPREEGSVEECKEDEFPETDVVLNVERKAYDAKLQQSIEKSHAAVRAVNGFKNIFEQCDKDVFGNLATHLHSKYPLTSFKFTEAHEDFMKPYIEVEFENAKIAKAFVDNCHTPAFYVTLFSSGTKIVAYANVPGGTESEKEHLEKSLRLIVGERVSNKNAKSRLDNLLPGLSLKYYNEEEFFSLHPDIQMQLKEFARLGVHNMDLDDLCNLPSEKLNQLKDYIRQPKQWASEDLSMLERVYSTNFKA
jgi:hypothetical protein